MWEMVGVSFHQPLTLWIYRLTVTVSPRVRLWPLGRFCSWLRVVAFWPVGLSARAFRYRRYSMALTLISSTLSF